MPFLPTIPLRRLPALLSSLRATYMYLVLIPFLNWAFESFPDLRLSLAPLLNWMGENLPGLHALAGAEGMINPLSILVGLILVVRDFVQREIGHWVFVPFVLACAASYALAGPEIAIASTASFAFSETVDWLVFTLTRRPLSKRILWSGAASVPVDTAIFLYGLNLAFPGAFQWSTFAGMIVSKMAGIYVVYLMVKKREARLGMENEKMPKNEDDTVTVEMGLVP